MKQHLPLTIIVHTRNEAENIRDCLTSCLGFASQVIVADMESDDETKELAASLCDQVIRLPLVAEFDRARNASAKAATNPWILYLDADERLTTEIRLTITSLLTRVEDDVAGYQLPYRVISFGSWIQHAGNWWPSYKSPALLRAGKFFFPGQVHRPATVDGRVVRVIPSSEADAILHLSHRDVAAYFEKLNRYTTLEVANLEESGEPNDWVEMAKRLGAVTAWYYDKTQGKRDGRAGFLLSLGSGIYEVVSRMKRLEQFGEIAVPPTAEEFFQVAADAARVEPEKPPAPPWVTRLFELTDNATRPLWLINGQGVTPAGASTAEYMTSPVTSVFASDDSALSGLVQHLERLGTGAMVLIDASSASVENRTALEAVIGEPHELVLAKSGERFLFWWKGEAVKPTRRAQLTTHQDALSVLGGGEVQLFETARALNALGVRCDIFIGQPSTPLGGYDLQHWFSVHHDVSRRQEVPVVITPIIWDRSELQWARNKLLAIFSHSNFSEEVDAGYAQLRSESKRLVGEREAFAFGNPQIADHCDFVAANADVEIERLRRITGLPLPKVAVVPNGVTQRSSVTDFGFKKELGLDEYVLCVGRIEANKNQISLIWALRQTDIPIVLIGDDADPEFAPLCRSIAGPTVRFLGSQPTWIVRAAMEQAAAHCLPSFGETPGLANLEAASVGCPIVVSNRGAEREYFGDLASYCDPLDPSSILSGIVSAMSANGRKRATKLRNRVRREYSWDRAARATADIYEGVLRDWHESQE